MHLRKVLVLLALMLLAPVAAVAMAPARAVAASGDLITSAILDSAGIADDYAAATPFGDGGTLAAGYNRPWGVSAHTNGLLSLYAPTGALVWSSVYPSFRGLDASFRYVKTGGGAIYVAGRLQVTPTADDVLLAKYKPNGDPAWTRTYDGSGHADDEACGFVLAADGDPIVVSTEVMESGSTGIVVRRCSSQDGSVVWKRVWNRGGEDYATGTASDAAGGIYVSGGTRTGLSKQAWDAVLLKVTPAGKLAWVRVRNGVRSRKDEWEAIAVKGGSVYVAGTADVLRNGDVMVARYSSAGALRWLRTWGSAAGRSESGGDVAVTGKGDVVVSGYQLQAGSTFGGFVAKWNGAGVRGWARMVSMSSGQANLTHVAVGSNGAVYAAGWTGVLAEDSVDWMLVRYSISGKRVWLKTYDGGAQANDLLRDMYTSGAACVMVGTSCTSPSSSNTGGWFGRIAQ